MPCKTRSTAFRTTPLRLTSHECNRDLTPSVWRECVSQLAAQEAKQKQNTINLLWKKATSGKKEALFWHIVFFILQKGEKVYKS